MGRFIDGLCLRAAGIVLAYLLFLHAWGSVPLACGLTLLTAALAALALKGRPHAHRRTPAQARAALLALAGRTEAEASAELGPLIARRWPGEDCRLCPLLKHPSAGVGANDVLGLWKANRDAERLLIAATCPADAGARAFAQSLSAPAVAVLDDRALLRLLRDAPEAASPPPPLRHVLRQARERVAALLARPVPPRALALALALLAMYLRLGQPLYLFAGLWVAFRLALRMMDGLPRRRLFD